MSEPNDTTPSSGDTNQINMGAGVHAQQVAAGSHITQVYIAQQIVAPFREANQQISKIMGFAREFELPNHTSEESLKAITRQLHSLLGYAFLDTCEVSPLQDFVYLLSLNRISEKDGSITLQLELVCHITPFVTVFDEILSTLFDKSDQEFLVRTSKYPSDLNIKFSYVWATNVPYRITRIGPKSIRVDCLDSNHFTVKFPYKPVTYL